MSEQIINLIENGTIVKQMLIVIFAIIVGVVISLISSYLSTKYTERIRIKSRIIERNIDIVSQLIELTKFMSTMTLIPNKQKSDLGFDYICDEIDEHPISIPCTLTEGWETDWYLKFVMLMVNTTRVMSLEIIHYEHFIQEYLLNVQLKIAEFPPEEQWKMAFVCKPDYRMISDEFTRLLECYLFSGIYKLNKSKHRWDEKKKGEYQKKLQNTNFIKYREQFNSLLSN